MQSGSPFNFGVLLIWLLVLSPKSGLQTATCMFTHILVVYYVSCEIFNHKSNCVHVQESETKSSTASLTSSCSKYILELWLALFFWFQNDANKNHLGILHVIIMGIFYSYTTLHCKRRTVSTKKQRRRRSNRRHWLNRKRLWHNIIMFHSLLSQA